MLAVGRALARRPSLLLLDELSLGLAPVIVQKLLPVIRSYATESGCAVLLVEQHVGMALDVADRGCVLAHGVVSTHAEAERLRADHGLILASYLGEQTARTPEMSDTSSDRPAPSDPDLTTPRIGGSHS
jgi:branched-chain amino acid transport system ATP-binding protein